MRTLIAPVPCRDGYRSDVDGLRAVAVLPVLAFHVARGQFPGGFVGVDIFYVISGYLITGLILRERRQGRFSYFGFYARRIRRIFPALVLILAFSCAAAWLLFPPRDLTRFGAELAGSAAFAANFVFWEQRGYFDADPYTRPLLHLWSLGVEEQFYIVWPLVLALLCRWRRGVAFGIVGLGLLSFGLNLHHSATDPAAGFYAPWSRAWELMLGAWLALRPPLVPGRWADVASFVGALLVAAAFLLISPGPGFPGWWALLPTLGAFLLIAAGPAGWVNRRLLSVRIAVAVGLISYPLYLWHWVLLSFGWFASFEWLDWPARAALAGLAFPLAWATWRFLERPVREGRLLSAPKLAWAMAALGAFGVLIWAAGGVPGRALPDEAKRRFVSGYRNERLDEAERDQRIGCGFIWGRRELPSHCIARGTRDTWLIWGDSHANSLAPGLRRNLPSGVALTRITTGGCPPDTGGKAVAGPGLPDCRRANRVALELVRRMKPLVILAQGSNHDRRDWEGMARTLRAAGAREVVLVGPLPAWRPSLPEMVASYHWPDIPPYVAHGLVKGALESDRRLAARLRASPDLRYLSLMEPLCRPEGCRATVPGGRRWRLMAIDYGHLSEEGSDYVARTIIVPGLGEAPSL
jgi:peptidoglycan/LPS O-acetylase OafA/YrhL